MRIRVRKETVKCINCKRLNDFLYLSDFSYGERLALFENGEKYAYINLLEDNIYVDFCEKVKTILSSYQKTISERELQNLINNLFRIACDKINNSGIDFVMSHRKCTNCKKQEFEDLLVEPAKIISIDLPSVTHKEWELLNHKERIQKIEEALKENKYI